MYLLLFGIVVFGLMLIGMVFTVAEFRRISDDDTSGLDTKANSDAAKKNVRVKGVAPF
ncbi:hypothetical protein ACFL1J_08545 [Pseudomonadota bacterium]